MNYKDYQSVEVKNGHIDIFLMEVEGKEVVEIFITDYLTHSTSSAIFNSKESFEKFINILLTIRHQ